MQLKTVLLCVLALSTLVATGCSESDSIVAPQTTEDALREATPVNLGAPAPVTMPFRGRYSTTFTPPTTPPPFLEFYIWGEGVSNVLGRSTWEGPSRVDLTQAPPVQTGASVFSAADGSQFTMTAVGIAVPGPDEVYDVGFQGTYTLSDGTGRFEGISGSGTYKGFASNSLGSGEIAYEGTMTLPRPPVTPVER